MKYLAFLILLTGCTENTSVLSLTPVTSYQSSIDNAALLTYSAQEIQVNGLIGQWKIMLTNTSDQDLTGVELGVTVNDPTLVFDFFTRIYHQISWGAGSFGLAGPVVLPDGSVLTNPFNTYYAVVDANDIPAHSSVSFDSVILGYPGLKLYYQAYATLPDSHTASSLNQPEVTVSFNF